jgi:hypothetical protein
MHLPLFLSALLLCLPGFVTATPITTRADGAVDPSPATQFPTINLYEQYSAAAYCPGNFGKLPIYPNNQGGTTLTCRARNCPLVEAAGATTVLEFEK